MSDDDAVQFRGTDAPVSTYMSDAVVALDPSASLRRAAEVIAEASIGCIVVGSAEAVQAVISERDIVLAVAQGRDLDATSIGDVGSTRLVWITPDASVGTVAEEMMEDYVRHVLVGDEGTVIGIVSMRDVIAAYTT